MWKSAYMVYQGLNFCGHFEKICLIIFFYMHSQINTTVLISDGKYTAISHLVIKYVAMKTCLSSMIFRGNIWDI
jgi:hypothetical protein